MPQSPWHPADKHDPAALAAASSMCRSIGHDIQICWRFFLKSGSALVKEAKRLLNRPSGCEFYTRCRYALVIGSRVSPDLQQARMTRSKVSDAISRSGVNPHIKRMM